VIFKVSVILKPYIPKKHKQYRTKTDKLGESTGCMYNMTAYLDKDRICATVTGYTTRTGNVGQKLYMNNFSSPVLLDDLHTKEINCCCGTVWPNQEGMRNNLTQTMRLKVGDEETRVRGNFTLTETKDDEM
jgi:hypothetical protein